MKYKYILRIVNESQLEAKLHQCQDYGYEIVSINPHVRHGTSLFAIIARKPNDEAKQPSEAAPVASRITPTVYVNDGSKAVLR